MNGTSNFASTAGGGISQCESIQWFHLLIKNSILTFSSHATVFEILPISYYMIRVLTY